MIKMGMAKAYDFKLLLPMLALLSLGLTAACIFSEKPPSGDKSNLPSALDLLLNLRVERVSSRIQLRYQVISLPRA